VELTKLLDRTWTHQNGAHLRLAKLAVDTGYEAPAVYAWSRRQGVAQVAPVKGVEGFNRSSPVSGPTCIAADRIPFVRGEVVAAMALVVPALIRH
jgi:phage terminase large subunit GpA-like protein